MYTLFLILHLGGAAVTGLVATYSVLALVRHFDSEYRRLAGTLGLLAGFEIMTGVCLSVISSQVTALSLCSNIAVYLGVVALVESALFLRMQKMTMTFPIRLVLSPSSIGLALLLIGISYGV
jgi:hypothetical protein